VSTPDPSQAIAGPVREPRNRAAHVAGSIHDDATASKLGFRGGTVAGSVHMDQFPPLLLEAFGPAWFETGTLSLYFKFATTDGEPVQAFVERPAPGAAAGAQVRAWMTTPGGTLVAEGTASAGQPAEPSALFSRDLRPADPGQLRILSALRPGDTLGDLHCSVNGADQRAIISEGGITEPLDWYSGPSPWGGPIASPSRIVALLYRDLLAKPKQEMGPHVGLFGAIEIRFRSGPVFADQPYRVTGEVVALTDSPKTEGLWYDSHAAGDDGTPVADMRMYHRQLKASSPKYRDAAAV
jgi:hypothetical protein